jgi:hypothetical protein
LRVYGFPEPKGRGNSKISICNINREEVASMTEVDQHYEIEKFLKDKQFELVAKYEADAVLVEVWKKGKLQIKIEHPFY